MGHGCPEFDICAFVLISDRLHDRISAILKHLLEIHSSRDSDIFVLLPPIALSAFNEMTVPTSI